MSQDKETAAARGAARPDPVHTDAALKKFADALTSYVLDPMQWAPLLGELDRISNNLSSWDPSELLSQLSRAESLSWQIRQESDELPNSGFAWVLLDNRSRATGSSGNLNQLSDYLSLEPGSLELRFATESSRLSYEDARARLKSADDGHILVELSHEHHNGHRFGYLVAVEGLPDSLQRISSRTAMAMFIAEQQPTDRLRRVAQASFSLTDSETDVVLKVASGMTLKQAAAELGISVNTVRNHLQAAFDKSGINRQGDLVLMITQLSVILAATTSADRPAERGPVTPISPTPPQHFMILPDGRRLAYRTYGNPEGSPVVYFHESIGSSRLPPGTDAEARHLDLHLIAPERAGFGLSDGDPHYDYTSVSRDLRALLRHLRVSRAVMLGNLSGGAFALAMAALHPDLVSRVLLVSARTPGPMTGRFQHLMKINRKLLGRPWMVATFFNILRNRASRENNGRLIKSVYGAIAHDREYLEANPRMFEHIVSCTMESFSVSTAGVVNELRCFAQAAPPIAAGITAPISAWHGTQDQIASIADLRRYLQALPVEWHEFEGAGSLIALQHWQEVLEAAAEDTGSR